MIARLWRRLRRGKGRECYWLAFHFADAEQAAAWVKRHPEIASTISSLGARGIRLLKSGERIPVCRGEYGDDIAGEEVKT